MVFPCTYVLVLLLRMPLKLGSPLYLKLRDRFRSSFFSFFRWKCTHLLQRCLGSQSFFPPTKVPIQRRSNYPPRSFSPSKVKEGRSAKATCSLYFLGKPTFVLSRSLSLIPAFFWPRVLTRPFPFHFFVLLYLFFVGIFAVSVARAEGTLSGILSSRGSFSLFLAGPKME